MGVGDAVNVMARGVNGAVDHKAGLVDRILRGVEQDLAIDVDADEAGGGDLVVQHAVGVEQELVGGAGDACRNVVRGQLGHVEHFRQPVGGCQVDADVPFLLADLFTDGLDDLECGRTHGRAPLGRREFIGLGRYGAKGWQKM